MNDDTDTQPTATPTSDSGEWVDWAAITGYSGFKVASRDGRVQIAQLDETNFSVSTSFAFVDKRTLDKLRSDLVASGTSEGEARRLVEDARVFHGGTEDTDLASVPTFMTWFQSRYGRLTLAAIIHDRLITSGEPNTGALGSDTLSDSFFRNMMGVAGMPLFKRWIIWAAVAMRTRWAAEGWRRVSLVLWVLSAVLGYALLVKGVVGVVNDTDGWFGLKPWLMIGIAAVGPFVSGLLWGKQFGASVVAAAAAAWILPPAALIIAGSIIYMVLEFIAGKASPHPTKSGPQPTEPPSPF